MEKQEVEGWGAKVIDRMSKDLCNEFPDMKGFSARNIKYMRKFALSWDNYEFVQQVVAQIPWRTNIKLLDKISDKECRIWYAKQAICNGWSSNILEVQIQGKLFERTGGTVNNFEVSLPKRDSDMARDIFKDPYLFDFLGTDMPRREIEIERKLIEHIQQFLLELGQGFAYVGRQVHLEIGGQDFGVNLICVEDSIDSSKEAGKLMISVLSAVAEIERENIRVQTMEGRMQKAREGKWNGGFPPYGYSLVDS